MVSPASAPWRTEPSQWVIKRRGPRNALDPLRPYAFFAESELASDGTLAEIWTVFLTNRECPWRCVMCDLWRNTLEETLPVGMIPQQMDYAFQRLRTPGGLPPRHVKLYNSGSFFDPKAIPSGDYPAIASRVASFERVIVECHPSLIGPRVAAFDRLLRGEDASSQGSAARLEVALGLETAHAEALCSLNKGLTVPDFQRACALLQGFDVAIRVFLLVHPPFVPREEQRRWLETSVLTALDAGASVVSLIPLRLGNGALDELAKVGLAAEPSLSALEDALDFGVGQRRARVFADLWDLDRFSTCAACLSVRRARLEEMNRSQRVLPRVSCPTCQRA